MPKAVLLRFSCCAVQQVMFLRSWAPKMRGPSPSGPTPMDRSTSCTSWTTSCWCWLIPALLQKYHTEEVC